MSISSTFSNDCSFNGKALTDGRLRRFPQYLCTVDSILWRHAGGRNFLTMEQPSVSATDRGRRFSIALVQYAPVKGNVEANLSRIGDALKALAKSKQPFPDVVVFPEAALSGYFVEGGVREVALSATTALERLNAVALKTRGRAMKPLDVVVGFFENDRGKLYNSALYATLGRSPQQRHLHRKMFLPTYGVFDEERFVSRGNSVGVFDTSHGRAAILICEDAVHSLSSTIVALHGAEIVYIPSASPGRGLQDGEPANVRLWREILRVAASEHGMFFAYAGLVGFEGGKGFTGSSKLIGPFGDLRVEAPFAGAAIVRASVNLEDVIVARAALPALGDLEANLPELTAQLNSVDGKATVARARPVRRKARRRRR